MNSQRDARKVDGSTPLAAFLERVRTSFSHDMRTPLGTIVNYSAVLETHEGAGADEIRDLGRRIRTNALRVSRMIQLVATATGLAARPLSAASTDMSALARSILIDAGGRGHVQLVPDGASTWADVDAEVVGFALRAYVSVENDARARPIDALDLRVEDRSGRTWLDVRCGDATANGTPPTELATNAGLPVFLSHDNGPARAECAMQLGLACDLIHSHGGDLHVWGRPGVSSGVRVSLPTTR